MVIASGCSSDSEKSSIDVKPPTSKKKDVQTEFTVNGEKFTLEKKEIIDNKIEVLIPQTFEIMSDETAKMKYPSEARPTIIYTNESGTTNVAFNYTENEATNDQINEVKDSIKSSFKQLYPSATWYDEKVENINGKNVAVLELLTPAIDTKIYNLIFLFELDGRLVMGTFNCIEEEKEEYEPIAKSIVKSIVVK
ncbi:hypothetical protein Curi_c14730 [Gottschalkia acidurici 9a]|uniref:Uncharacterized protein n=2 Tax=Clostridium acidurici TaxID=1556 RepID=K0AXE1_GOTA9|nr:hypothetical protein Curi_c14730 [Gottschalkia acidurici 9a]